MIYSRITGTGSSLPAECVSNADLAARGIDTSDEWIQARTGIKTRYIAAEDQTSSDLAFEASKAAINQLTRSAAVEYATDKIRVNAICPGGTETAIVAQLVRDHPEAVAASLALTPLGRLALPAEIADVALFLASDESSYVTGVALPVDGGYSVL